MKCYEILDCSMCNLKPKDAKCHPYREQISCIEFDWVSLYKSFPDSAEKDQWLDAMLENCPKCEVRKTNPQAVDKVIENLKEAGK